jgi:hypothetical protein
MRKMENARAEPSKRRTSPKPTVVIVVVVW